MLLYCTRVFYLFCGIIMTKRKQLLKEYFGLFLFFRFPQTIELTTSVSSFTFEKLKLEKRCICIEYEYVCVYEYI